LSNWITIQSYFANAIMNSYETLIHTKTEEKNYDSYWSRYCSTGIGIGIATSKAAEAVARQPEAESKITKILLLGGALAEATAIYGFVIGILIILFMA
jgi:F-type H+-transporting ATPase subunit c